MAADSIAQSILGERFFSNQPCPLEAVFPNLTKSQVSSIVDQNDKQALLFINYRLENHQGSHDLSLQVLRLYGAGQEFVLLTIQNQDGEFGHRFSDALTGLPDRREVVAFYHRWQQSSTRPPLAVLFLDLDQFKQINDQHGHAVGDQVLATLAQRWRTCIRDGDLVARHGGDEFVILLPGVGQLDEAAPVLTRLTEVTECPILIEGQQLHLGVTIGVALARELEPGNVVSLETLLMEADRDMYAKKRPPG